MATFADLVSEVSDNLERAKLDKSPNKASIVRRLNRAKDSVVGLIETYDSNQLIVRLDYDVDANQPYIDLPGTGDDTYQDVSDEPRYRRIVGVTDVGSDNSQETNIHIYDRRDEGMRKAPAGIWFYREGDKLYFNDVDGAPMAMTIRVRYSPVVADLSSDSTAEYDYIPPEWTDLIAMQATLDLLPSGNAERYKWERRKSERIQELKETISRRMNTGPMRIRMVDEWIW